MKLNIEFRPEQIDPSVYLAPDVVVLGDVAIGADSGVWFKAILRGDTEAIRVGSQTNIQDACILHADEGFPCILGDRVTVGHAAVVHGAIVEDDCMIGMRSLVMNGAKIGSGSIVAAGAVVTEGVEIPPGSIVMGAPAKVVKEASEKHQHYIRRAAEHYVAAAQQYRQAASQQQT